VDFFADESAIAPGLAVFAGMAWTSSGCRWSRLAEARFSLPLDSVETKSEISLAEGVLPAQRQAENEGCRFEAQLSRMTMCAGGPSEHR
jgi:hypothetical protein